ATVFDGKSRAYIWANGECFVDAGIVVVLETDVPFEVVTSSHLVPTNLRTVVTAASSRGRRIEELDGIPATRRLRQLIEKLGSNVDDAHPSEYAFARFIDGMPYVRALQRLDGEGLLLASSVEPGHVLRVMRPGDLIGQTREDLATAVHRLGGKASAIIAFSCI